MKSLNDPLEIIFVVLNFMTCGYPRKLAPHKNNPLYGSTYSANVTPGDIFVWAVIIVGKVLYWSWGVIFVWVVIIVGKVLYWP